MKEAGLLSLTHRPFGQFLSCNANINGQNIRVLFLARMTCFTIHYKLVKDKWYKYIIQACCLYEVNFVLLIDLYGIYQNMHLHK